MSIIVDQSAIERIQALRALKNQDNLVLRIRVEGGGCSGFQYKLDLTDKTEPHDVPFADTVVTDTISLPFLENAVVKFEESLIGSEFKIVNPNALSGCGCGTSFSVM
jgi:iron-sulfur cluster assembly accessory protein